MSERVWVVYVGDYEQRSSLGPAFAHKEHAEAFAKANDSGDIEEFAVHGAAAVPTRHYRCQGWMFDVRVNNDRFLGARIQSGDGFFWEEQSWDSWDVLVPQLELRTTRWSGGNKGLLDDFVMAQGRDRSQVRLACIGALTSLQRQHDEVSTLERDG